MAVPLPKALFFSVILVLLPNMLYSSWPLHNLSDFIWTVSNNIIMSGVDLNNILASKSLCFLLFVIHPLAFNP